jgi:hypothetical protein
MLAVVEIENLSDAKVTQVGSRIAEAAGVMGEPTAGVSAEHLTSPGAALGTTTGPEANGDRNDALPW